MPIVRALTKPSPPPSLIVNVTQSSPPDEGVALKIPAHAPAALLNAETEIGVDGGGGSDVTGAHPISPPIPPTSIHKQVVRSHSFIITSPLRRQRSVNTIFTLNEPLIYITR